MLPLTIRRVALAAILIAFGAAFFAHPLTPAYACSCVPARPPLESRDEAQAVFSGTVSAVQPDAGGLLVTFDVDRVWKGPEDGALTLATSGSSASCGVEFVEGEQYLVYGLAQDGQLTTNLCTRTAPLASAGEDLAALGPGSEAPAAAEVPGTEVSVGLPWGPIAIGACVLALLAVGAALAFRRRR
jgi:hypothetical protein